MRVLVTGGTGVLGEGTVTVLVSRGHHVRLLSRHAKGDAARWPHRVEAFEADIADGDSLAGAADQCDAVLHLAGIADEAPPETTFERINVEGTAHLLAEARRAGAPRFVYVSSLGADKGKSGYHASKRRAERLVRQYPGDWLILRPGNTYGGGDGQLSMLLRMVRSLPAVPVLTGGDAPFEPAWVGDMVEALAAAVERTDLTERVLELAGPERTTVDDVIERLARITGRDPVRLPVPMPIASLAIKLADLVGVDAPLGESQLAMLGEGNVVTAPEGNALTTVLGVQATPLEEGLCRLAAAQPEQLPDEGVGALERKRFHADIIGSAHTAASLFALFVGEFQACTPQELMNANAEPDSAPALEEGATLTLALPVRGNVQVRVVELDETSMTFVTLAGHPLAGGIRFCVRDRGDALRFEIDVVERPASLSDWLMMRVGGGRMQDAAWRETVTRVVERSGGMAEQVESSAETLQGEEADRERDHLASLVLDRAREDHEVRRTPRRDDAPAAAARPRRVGEREDTVADA